MFRLFLKRVFSFFKTLALFYFKKTRSYKYRNIKIKVLPGVFFPHFTHSTKILLQFTDTINLQNKNFLELGCGTGIISVLAAKKNAAVTASDINPSAVKNVQLNADKNQVKVSSVLSDLFNDIPKQLFDFIIINPPYYPKNPSNISESAWFCGNNFQYFERLFSEAGPYFNDKSEVYMILSEDCNIDKIKEIALKNKIEFTIVLIKKKWGERNYIFRLKCI